MRESSGASLDYRDRLVKSSKSRARFTGNPSPNTLARDTGMKDILVHDYFGVNISLIWNIVTIELPPLKLAISMMLEELSE